MLFEWLLVEQNLFELFSVEQNLFEQKSSRPSKSPRRLKKRRPTAPSCGQIEHKEAKTGPGADSINLEPILHTIVSYNASAVKIYDATRSVVRFENIGKYFILL
jgi:hypothetical protein